MLEKEEPPSLEDVRNGGVALENGVLDGKLNCVLPTGGKFLTAARIAKTGGKENCPYRRDRPQNGKYLCRSGTDRKRCLQILSEKR